uniref:Uncharacterized protein n=1 Tax=Cacopsylla melanoneura TaxID=428564 RepID=A0A8D8RYW6_9HEMI
MSFNNKSIKEDNMLSDSSDEGGDPNYENQIGLPSWYHQMPIALKKFMIFERESNSEDHLFWADNGNKSVRASRIKLKNLYGKLKIAIPKGNKDAIAKIRKKIEAKEKFFFKHCVRKVEIDHTIPETKPMPRPYRSALYQTKKSELKFKVKRSPLQKKELLKLKRLKKRYNAMVRIKNKYAPYIGNELYHKEFVYRQQFLTLLNPDEEQKEITDEVMRAQRRDAFLEKLQNKKKKKKLDFLKKKKSKNETLKRELKKGEIVPYCNVPPLSTYPQQTEASSRNSHSNPPTHKTSSHGDQSSLSSGQNINRRNDAYNQQPVPFITRNNGCNQPGNDLNNPGGNIGFNQPGNGGYSQSGNGGYNLLFKRSSTFMLTIAVGSFAFERSFDRITEYVWERKVTLPQQAKQR